MNMGNTIPAGVDPIATVILNTSGVVDNEVKKHCKGLASRAFGEKLCPVDGRYSASVKKYTVQHLRGQDIYEYRVAQDADFMHSFYVRIALYDGARVENAFDRFEVTIGGAVSERRTLAKTIAMCKARGVWPSFTNRSVDYAYVPLLIQAPPVIPLHVLFMHEVNISFYGIHKDVRIDAIFNEMVYLESSARSGLDAAIDTHQPISAPGPNLDHDYGLTNIDRRTIEWSFVHTIKSKSITTDICTQPVLAATAIIVSLHFDHTIDAAEHPLRSSSLKFLDKTGYEFDAVMLEEINWQRCGLLPPTQHEPRQDFLYLIPFSREAFADPPMAWINFCVFHEPVLLCMELARDDYGDVRVAVSVESMNVRKYLMGMSGAMFAP